MGHLHSLSAPSAPVAAALMSVTSASGEMDFQMSSSATSATRNLWQDNYASSALLKKQHVLRVIIDTGVSVRCFDWVTFISVVHAGSPGTQ